MTTVAHVREAHLFAPKHRFALRDLVKVDEPKASADDMKLIRAMRSARSGEEFDAAIHSLALNRLFVRGVVYIGEKK